MSPDTNSRPGLLFVSSIRLPRESDSTARKKWDGLSDHFDVHLIGFSRGGFTRIERFGCQFFGIPGNLWFPLRVILYYLCTPVITVYLSVRYSLRYWTAQGPYEAMAVGWLKYLLKPLVTPRLIIEAHGDWIDSFLRLRTLPMPTAVGFLLRGISPLLLLPADGFRSVSDGTRSMIEKHGLRDVPHSTFPGFTNLDLFLDTTLDEKLELESPTVLYAGALTELKGIPELLRATKQVLLEEPSMTLKLAGPGQIKPFEERVDNLNITDSVEFLGEVSQDVLRDCYLRARLLVLPSHTEGLPRVLLEALACHTPFLATKTPGSEEIYRKSRGGRIVPRGKPDRLATEMLDLYRSQTDRRRLGKRGRKYVEETHSTEQFFKNYVKLVERIDSSPYHSGDEMIHE